MALPREHLLDALATAYVQAVAAAGGATIAVGRDYGVDGTLKHIVKVKERFVESVFPVEFQLKGTTSASVRKTVIVYDLKVRNHDLIVFREPFATPIYLFLVCFTTRDKHWIVQDTNQLTLNAQAYWWSSADNPTENAATVRIEIPIANRLTPAAIAAMLRSSKERFGQ
jgi:hypothetical protein